MEGLHYFIPSEGFISDARTAVRVAEAILVPIYGEKVINDQKPFSAQLQGDHWLVSGYLPDNYLGGVALVVINKSDGRILRVSHGL